MRLLRRHLFAPLFVFLACARALAAPADTGYDVVVVGGGPAGLAAAIEAKQNGAARVLVVEQRSEARARVQVLNMRRRTLDNLARLGVSLEPDRNVTFLKRRYATNDVTGEVSEHRVGRIRVDAKKASYRVGDMLPMDTAQAAVMTTNILEHELIEAAKRAGVELVFESPVTGIGHDPSGAWTEFAGRRVRSDFVVVADGANSDTRARLGIGRVGYAGKSTRIIGGVFAQPGQREIVSRKVVDPNVKALGLAKMGTYGSSGVLVEVPPDKIFTSPAERQAFFTDKAAQLGVHGDLALPASEFTVALTNAERVTVGGRVLLIGDAARTTHVFTGLGVNWALRDAARFGKMFRRYRDAGDDKGRKAAVSWFGKETMQASYRLHRRAWNVFDNLGAKGSPPSAKPTLKQIRKLGVPLRRTG